MTIFSRRTLKRRAWRFIRGQAPESNPQPEQAPDAPTETNGGQALLLALIVAAILATVAGLFYLFGTL